MFARTCGCYYQVNDCYFSVAIAPPLLVQIRIQELAEQVPKGHIPRSMSVHCKGEITRMVSGRSTQGGDVTAVLNNQAA